MTELEGLSQLKSRCAAAGLSIEESVISLEDEDGNERSRSLGGSIFSKGEEFSVRFQFSFGIDFLLSTRFEDFRPIPGYEAMWSQRHGIIEAGIVLRPPMFPDDHAFTEVLLRLDVPSPDHERLRALEIPFPSESGDPRISLRFASRELLIWRTADPATGQSLSEKDDPPSPCIRIEGLALGSEEEAKKQLEAFGNGALLELERQTDIAARLKVHQSFRIRFIQSPPAATLRRVTSTPEAAPMSLYMHAQLGTGNLAATFLGFYQALEYFFPRYSILVELRKLREALSAESSSFSGISDNDLRLIIERVQRSGGGRGFGAERSQFKETLNAIVTKEELRTFISRSQDLSAFYSKPDAPIVKERISLGDTKQDLRSAAAERLYEIRCRIAHAKEERDREVFIPFATEVFELGPDVELIRFLARRALWKCEQPIRGL